MFARIENYKTDDVVRQEVRSYGRIQNFHEGIPPNIADEQFFKVICVIDILLKIHLCVNVQFLVRDHVIE